MFCHIAERKFSDLTAKLEDAALEKRLPYMGVLELTYRCNQACCHCYCNLGLHDTRERDELSTAEVKRILDEMADAGCLWLLLSGGEVMVREDFWEIYLHALRKGMFVAVFTNATLIDDEMARRLADYPPLAVDISVYGADAALHDLITRTPGSFNRTMTGIARLREYGVPFALKSILMTLNYHHLGAMRKLAQVLGVEFRTDALIASRLDGGTGPARYRISTDDMIAVDLGDEAGRTGYREMFASFWGKDRKEVFACGAGVFGFNVDPYGIVSPCTMFSSFRYSLREKGFGDAWRSLSAAYAAAEEELMPEECRACKMRFICSNCPAWSEVETKRLRGKVPYLCEYAKRLEESFFLLKEGTYAKETV